MAHVAEFYQPAQPEKRPEKVRDRARLRMAVRKQRAEVEAKRKALIGRLKAKAALANDPANWVSLAGLSDDELKASLFRP